MTIESACCEGHSRRPCGFEGKVRISRMDRRSRHQASQRGNPARSDTKPQPVAEGQPFWQDWVRLLNFHPRWLRAWLPFWRIWVRFQISRSGEDREIGVESHAAYQATMKIRPPSPSSRLSNCRFHKTFLQAVTISSSHSEVTS